MSLWKPFRNLTIPNWLQTEWWLERRTLALVKLKIDIKYVYLLDWRYVCSLAIYIKDSSLGISFGIQITLLVLSSKYWNFIMLFHFILTTMMIISVKIGIKEASDKVLTGSDCMTCWAWSLMSTLSNEHALWGVCSLMNSLSLEHTLWWASSLISTFSDVHALWWEIVNYR